MAQIKTIALVAGEVSGDALGADLMTQIKNIDPSVRFVGVGGEKMKKAGLTPIIAMDRLSVMGISEVIRHLPDLFAAKREILSALDDEGVDIFIGIDAPDFNLRLGKALKAKGVFCVQYVSPSIWAWRQARIHTLKKATDLVLCLFPFELPPYVRHDHPAVCVGHPLLALTPPNNNERTNLKNVLLSLTDTPKDAPLLCLMAGSRNGEIVAILPTLLQSMAKIINTHPNAHALLPLAKDEQKTLVQSLIDKNAPHLRHRLHTLTPSDCQHTLTISQMAMSVSDVTLIASGTATLEAAVLGSPMVVVYKVSPTTYHIAKRLLYIPYVSLPNLLSHHLFGRAVVPELIQDAATPLAIYQHACALIQNATEQKNDLAHLSQTLQNTSSTNPAAAIFTAYRDSR